MATFFQRLLAGVFFLFKHKWLLLGGIVLSMVIALGIGKLYQNYWDTDEYRGAITDTKGGFDENYSKLVYLNQGWTRAQSLWFYNTTQGSGLMPYDFFLSLEQADSQELLRSNHNIDKYRYLPQRATPFNPDALPVGFVKDTYKGRDYMGYTCAACHTGQVNYKDTAIRIDGGPAMADMPAFLTSIQKAMEATLKDPDKKQRFVASVLALKNDYDTADEVLAGLDESRKTIQLYNIINYSHLEYGYGRLDAFGRIYNRVLQHMINKPQLADAMKLAISPTGQRLLSDAEVQQLLAGTGEYILRDKEFIEVLERLQSTAQFRGTRWLSFHTRQCR